MTLFQMAKTVLTSLFGKPATLMYPFKPAKKFKSTRGQVVNDISRCIYCGSCARKCPAVAICVDNKARTWEIDRFRCVACNCCVEACPVKCLSMSNDYPAPTTEGQMKLSMHSEKPPAPAPKPAVTAAEAPKK